MNNHRQTTSTTPNSLNDNYAEADVQDNITPNMPGDPDCPYCSGMGLVTLNVPVGHDDFGKAFVCVCRRAEIKQQRYQRLLDLSNLASYSHMRFDNFIADDPSFEAAQSKILQNALSMVLQFVERLSHNWLVLEGNYGAGKTHLAAALGNYLVDTGHSVMFLTVPDLLDHLRTTYSPSSGIRYDELFEVVKDVHVLILDDLGTEAPTEWAGEKLFQLLNHRYVKMLPTVITTNSNIEKLDGRIASRLKDRRFVWRVSLRVPDFRQTQGINLDDTDMTEAYRMMTFDNFDPYTDNLKRAEQLMKQFIQRRDNMGAWIILMGKHGSGKTHLCAAVANQLRANGESLIFLTVSDLIDYLRDAFNSRNETVNQRLQQLREVPVLILDNLSMRTASAWAEEKLFQVIEYRYMMQLPLIATITPSEMEQLSDRFKSRFLDRRVCTQFQIEAPAYFNRTNRIDSHGPR